MPFWVKACGGSRGTNAVGNPLVDAEDIRVRLIGIYRDRGNWQALVLLAEIEGVTRDCVMVQC